MENAAMEFVNVWDPLMEMEPFASILVNQILAEMKAPVLITIMNLHVTVSQDLVEIVVR